MNGRPSSDDPTGGMVMLGMLFMFTLGLVFGVGGTLVVLALWKGFGS